MRMRKGYSLVEVLIALAIAMIIATAVITALISQLQLTSTQNRNIINQEAIRDTVNFVTDEVLAMGSGIVEPYLRAAGDDELDYIGDVDGDGHVDRVHFWLSGQELRRTLYETPDDGLTWNSVTTDVMISNVQSLEFNYYALGNIAMTTPVSQVETADPADDVSDVTSLEIKLELDTTMDTTARTSGKVSEQKMIGRITIRNRLY